MVIAVLCPSRGNPQALGEAIFSFSNTKLDVQTRFVAVLDENDPEMEGYAEVLEDSWAEIFVVPSDKIGNMNLALNEAAKVYVDQDVDVIGFIGDDHRFRTPGWDRVISKILTDEGGGFAFGNDLYMGDYLPTQVFVSSAIIRSLGWMGLPGARHLYLDNTWKQLGNETSSLYYLPDIVIEHMHPVAGKGEWDENHKRVNSNEMYAHDREVFEGWLGSDQYRTDVTLVRGALAALRA